MLNVAVVHTLCSKRERHLPSALIVLVCPFQRRLPADPASVLCCKYCAIERSLLDPEYILKQSMCAMLTATRCLLHVIPLQ